MSLAIEADLHCMEQVINLALDRADTSGKSMVTVTVNVDPAEDPKAARIMTKYLC